MAHVGISLEENIGMSYFYSLPNKIFDYIHAGIPVLASDFPEIKNIVEGYQIGITTTGSDPKLLAEIINFMLHDEKLRKKWKKNIEKAISELNWEKEKLKLIDFYQDNKLL